jgi:shikimate dehydrogenase
MQLRAVDGTTKLTGLLGHPVAHSRSPRIHQYWLSAHKINARYLAFDIAPTHLKEAITGAQALGVLGLNVTLPYKEAVLEYADTVCDIAREIGAANTLIFSDGNIHATNTDAYGMIENLKHSGGNLSSKLSRVVVLGAGGAARAAICALAQEGAKEIICCNRTKSSAEALARNVPYPITVVDWDKREQALEGTSLLINTTSLGMQSHEPLHINLEKLPKEAWVHDVVYAPLETDLLKSAHARGNRIITGIGMLVFQAQKSFEHWHGILPSIDDVVMDYACGK